MLRFSGAGVSDVGLVRDSNEDSGFVGSLRRRSSPTASVALPRARSPRRQRRTPSRRPRCSGPGVDPVRVSPRRSRPPATTSGRASSATSSRLGMATTLTGPGHRRPQRGARPRGRLPGLPPPRGGLRQITADHTYVQHLVETGRLSDQARATHPWRNVVLRSLDGDPEGAAPDVDPPRRPVGDRLLICSDGLTDLVDDDADRGGPALGGPEAAAAELTRRRAARRRPRQHHLVVSTSSTGRAWSGTASCSARCMTLATSSTRPPSLA